MEMSLITADLHFWMQPSDVHKRSEPMSQDATIWQLQQQVKSWRNSTESLKADKTRVTMVIFPRYITVDTPVL